MRHRRRAFTSREGMTDAGWLNPIRGRRVEGGERACCGRAREDWRGGRETTTTRTSDQSRILIGDCDPRKGNGARCLLLPNGYALKLPALTHQQQGRVNVPRNSPREQRPVPS